MKENNNNPQRTPQLSPNRKEPLIKGKSRKSPVFFGRSKELGQNLPPFGNNNNSF